jgi:tryptophan synthase alpha chain
MSRITQTFAALDRPALISFIMGGDPDNEASLAMLKALPKAGADIIELGMAFTDPMADGPVIEAAGLRALKAGASLKQTLKMVTEFREDNQDTPIVLMGYANPLYAYGLERFAKDATTAGVDGILLVDMPPEESADLEKALEANSLDLIRLITPTTDKSRLQTLLRGAGGFLYYVAITGVTGAASADLAAVRAHVETIKGQTDMPVAVGFGIKTPEDAAQFSAFADGVVVGSSIVKTLFESGRSSAEKLVTDLATALKS